MKPGLSRRHQNIRIANHLIFWLICLLFFTLSHYLHTETSSYQVAFNSSLFIIPIHALYFYSVAYWIMPKFLSERKYLQMGFSFSVIALSVAVLYRINEILFIEPYLLKTNITESFYRQEKPNGTIFRQLIQPDKLLNAIKASNTVIWLAISLKLLSMWHQRKQLDLQAELKFLKAQIHPHFLFNTLNNLYALTLNKSNQSPAVVLGLSEIIRYMLYECNTENVKLARDLEILKNYVALEKIRYEDRLELNFNIIGDTQNFYIAPLLMLPLVENAFKHGTSETINGPWINIDIKIIENLMKFKVSNSKPLKKMEHHHLHFEKIGLENVSKRLEFIYKDAYQFHTYEEDEIFVSVLELRLHNTCTGANTQRDKNLAIKTSK